MRICSLVPAATEVLFALGLGDRVVGVTHECDWPPEASERPVVTASLIQTGDLSSGEIDRVVAETARDGRPLYAIEEEPWAEIEADVVVMQELCDVCAVSTDQVERRRQRAGRSTSRCSTSPPRRWTGIADEIVALGAEAGRRGRGRGARRRDAEPDRPRRLRRSQASRTRRACS